MDPGQSNGSDPTGVTSSGVTATSPAGWSAWETYYREASRRRRARGGGRELREEKRRRRIRERLGIGISAMLVLGMTAIFYLVLR
jgi:hypothetical protein